MNRVDLFRCGGIDSVNSGTWKKVLRMHRMMGMGRKEQSMAAKWLSRRGAGKVARRMGRTVEEAAPVLRWSTTAATAGVVAGSVVAGTISGLASMFARTVVTPVKNHAEDLEILAVVSVKNQPHRQEIILPATEETTVPGTYSLVFDGGRGIARIGQITSFDPADGTVQRAVEEVYSGDLARALRGRWTGFIYPTPADMGFDAEDVAIPVDRGSAPAWLIRPEPGGRHAAEGRPGASADTWAIMVHGRGARRQEGIRAIATARAMGMTSLLISYRNDGEAPAADDGKYGLGATEWRDVEAAIRFALERGANEVVLFGWSMGAAVCLQLTDRSELAPRVAALVLSGPVINWIDVLAHQARLNRLPEAVGRLGQYMITSPAGRRITGLAAPVDLKTMDWVSRADQLRVPTLILHSEDDTYVPVGPSLQLAQKNPSLVTFVRFTQARHTREWNVDPERWDTAVRVWLESTLSAPRPGMPAIETAVPLP